MEQLVEDYLELVYRTSHSWKSKHSAEMSLRCFEKFCRSKYQNDVLGIIIGIKKNKLDVYQVLNSFIGYMDALTDRNGMKRIAASSMRPYMNHTRRYLALNDVIINDDMFKVKVRMPKVLKEKRMSLNREIIMQVLNVLPIKMRVITLMIMTSLRRPSEISQLWIRDIDFERIPTPIHIPASISKNRSEDISFISQETKQLLLQLLGDSIRNPDQKLFPEYSNHETAVIHMDDEFRYHLKSKLPALCIKKSSSPKRNKLTLYAFKDYGFTRAEKMFDTDFARELKGDISTEYSNYSDEEKAEMYLLLEPELTIFNADGVKRILENKYNAMEEEMVRIRRDYNVILKDWKAMTEEMHSKKSTDE